MHTRFFFIFEPEKSPDGENMTSQIAREKAYHALINDPTFVSDTGGHFGSSIADWFVIGGRWSGALKEAYMKKDWEKDLHKVVGHTCKQVKPQDPFAKDCFGITNKDIENHKKELQKLWEDAGGTGICNYLRSSYQEYGYEDDAMLIDKKIYDTYLKEHEGDYTDSETFVDWDYEPIKRDIIGKKWIVVVDYHM